MRIAITRNDGTTSEHDITPAIEVAFEKQHGAGMAKVFREHERSTDVYWLAWECLRRTGSVVPPFGDQFLDTLQAVEIVDDRPNG